MGVIASGSMLTPQRLSLPTGQVSVSFTALTTFDVAVGFGFTFASNPRVFCNIATTSGATALFSVRAYNVTTTGFTLRVWSTNGSSNTWTGVPVTWVAIPA